MSDFQKTRLLLAALEHDRVAAEFRKASRIPAFDLKNKRAREQKLFSLLRQQDLLAEEVQAIQSFA